MNRTLSRMVLLTALAAAAVLVAGCTQAPTPAAPTPPPATPTPTPATTAVKNVDGVQVVTIQGGEFNFAPADLTLKQGKTKFVFANGGKITHEFLLYPTDKAADFVAAHKKEMSGGMKAEEMVPGALVVELEDVDGGKIKESAVIDLKPGTYEMGCLIPGHYEAGMKGKIVVA